MFPERVISPFCIYLPSSPYSPYSQARKWSGDYESYFWITFLIMSPPSFMNLGKILPIRASGFFYGKWRVSSNSVVPTNLTTNVPFYFSFSYEQLSCCKWQRNLGLAFVVVALGYNKVLLGVMPELDDRDAGVDHSWVHTHKKTTVFWAKQTYKQLHSTWRIRPSGASRLDGVGAHRRANGGELCIGP